MTHVAYRWGSDLFCEGDIVSVITDHKPWSAWVAAGHEPSVHSAEEELDDIAEFLGIDRHDPEQMLMYQFPLRIPYPPEGFCAVCLCWFV
jgi:hypothetical protein